jgi:phosphatidylserine decarboxylase
MRLIDKLSQQEQINFLLTNKVPRRLLTLFMGWFSQVEQPIVRNLSIGVWKLFAGDLNLHDAKKTRFASLHDCFIRELKAGARPVDQTPGVLVSPCDGIVGASGQIRGTELVQAKDSLYTLEELLGDSRSVELYRDGRYVTLRLTSSMYHRFHSPYDCAVDGVTYVHGDTWNVNPIALKRIERLYCKNERAIVHLRLAQSTESVTLVPVGAILVASIHFNFIPMTFDLTYKGPTYTPCRASFRKGDELGYFRHGSTIIAFATKGLELCEHVREGVRIRMGEALLRHR